jgi:hypothetical protein
MRKTIYLQTSHVFARQYHQSEGGGLHDRSAGSLWQLLTDEARTSPDVRFNHLDSTSP